MKYFWNLAENNFSPVSLLPRFVDLHSTIAFSLLSANKQQQQKTTAKPWKRWNGWYLYWSVTVCWLTEMRFPSSLAFYRPYLHLLFLYLTCDSLNSRILLKWACCNRFFVDHHHHHRHCKQYNYPGNLHERKRDSSWHRFLRMVRCGVATSGWSKEITREERIR